MGRLESFVTNRKCFILTMPAPCDHLGSLIFWPTHYLRPLSLAAFRGIGHTRLLFGNCPSRERIVNEDAIVNTTTRAW